MYHLTASAVPWRSIFGFALILMEVLIFLSVVGFSIYLMSLLVRALRKYLASGEIRRENAAICRSLGEAIKENRTRCRMTQEFVAEHLGVSRQAVSKWENGTSDPSTANLLALARLFGIPAEELLKSAQPEP